MRNIIRCFAAIAVAIVLIPDASAETIAGWDYNAESSPGNASEGTGTTSGSFYPFTSALPLQTGSSGDDHVEIVNGGPNNANAQRSAPAPQEASGTRLFGVNTSTAGFDNIKVIWDLLAGFRTSRFYQLFATADGTTFDPVPNKGVGSSRSTLGVGSATVSSNGLITVNIDDGFIPDPNPATAPDYLFKLSYKFPSGTAYDNNPNFGFRVAAVHDPAAGDYVSSFAGTTDSDAVSGYTRSTSAGGGTSRYDKVLVKGDAVIPEPTGLALAVCSLALAGVTRRRK